MYFYVNGHYLTLPFVFVKKKANFPPGNLFAFNYGSNIRVFVLRNIFSVTRTKISRDLVAEVNQLSVNFGLEVVCEVI
jgi:hypothetical protein